ncbi:MAG: winged helix-turn-helix domain-containing protein [Candidatus Glassbacteria bacterium]|nr:winged helix-turn-helix domain-containing protein [Candidatus Glassbacteria bacterium]
MKAQIGAVAGKIWQALKGGGEVNISQLPKTLNEKQVLVYQALGWLAREGKIEYRTKGSRTYVSLSDSEWNI